MHEIKPLQTGFTHRVIEHQGKFFLCASVTLYQKFDEKEALIEHDAWTQVLDVIGQANHRVDYGFPKPQGEVLVSGQFFSANQRPVDAGQVSIQLSTVNKKLLVFGNREWKKTAGMAWGVSKPALMTQMPIDYEHAYGGEGYDKNPEGKGFYQDDTEDNQKFLANIELPNQLIDSPTKQVTPAGFGPLDDMWQPRKKLMGTFDEAWLRNRFPGYPDDLDWKYFNSAPLDQWIKKYFKGTESFEIHNMHPEKPVQKGQLPGYRVRCFFNRPKEKHKENAPIEEQYEFFELPLNLDTVWLYPEKSMYSLIWRGVIEVSDDEASEMEDVVVAYENQKDEPRTHQHYRDAMYKYFEEEEDPKVELSTVDLIPIGATCGYFLLFDEVDISLEDNLRMKRMRELKDKEVAKGEALKEATLKEAEESLEAKGIDPKPYMDKIKKNQEREDPPEVKKLKEMMDEALPKKADNPDEIDMTKIDPKKMDKIKAEAKKVGELQKQNARQEMVNTIEKLKQEQSRLDPNWQHHDTMKSRMDQQIDRIQERLDAMDGPQPLPRLDIEPLVSAIRYQKQQYEALCRDLKQRGLPEPKPANIPDPDELEENMKEKAQQFKENYRIGAHFLEEGLSPHKEQEEAIIKRFLNAYENQEDMTSKDFACLDLSKQSFKNLNLNDCFLEQTKLCHNKISESSFNEAIMARADLANVHISHCSFTGTNLGNADLSHAVFENCDLSGAILSKSKLHHTRFIHCNLSDVEFMETSFEKADFSQSDMSGATFTDQKLPNCIFKSTDLSEVSFLECDVTGSDFTSAKVHSVTFADTPANKCKFDLADLKSVGFFGMETYLQNTSFQRANIEQSNFQSMDMEKADFTLARIENCLFSGAFLEQAKFSYSYAQKCQFDKANVNFAKMDHADLVDTSFRKAFMIGTDFKGSNLYRANFLRATVGENTDFSDANLQQTYLEEWRPTK